MKGIVATPGRTGTTGRFPVAAMKTTTAGLSILSGKRVKNVTPEDMREGTDPTGQADLRDLIVVVEIAMTVASAPTSSVALVPTAAKVERVAIAGRLPVCLSRDHRRLSAVRLGLRLGCR
jgi:hypothetical protein